MHNGLVFGTSHVVTSQYIVHFTWERLTFGTARVTAAFGHTPLSSSDLSLEVPTGLKTLGRCSGTRTKENLRVSVGVEFL